MASTGLEICFRDCLYNGRCVLNGSIFNDLTILLAREFDSVDSRSEPVGSFLSLIFLPLHKDVSCYKGAIRPEERTVCTTLHLLKIATPSAPLQARNAMPPSPIEIWKIIVNYYTPTREEYAITLPWKRSASQSTLVALTQVCSVMRRIALPLVWAIVYIETMKDWGLLWKRICRQSGQHVHTFINFWAIARLPPYCMDHLKERGKDLLWYAFIDRKNNPLCDLVTGHKNIRYDPYEKLGNGPDGHG